MAKYILFKYDDERFASGDVIRNYPVKRVELTKQQIEWTIELLEASKHLIDCDEYRNKLKEVINEK